MIIVDEFTGRLMPGRRWSDGLHQAVEAKEGVRIERENQTLATITIQNYFRMYNKLAGMTGTADTESVEFKNIYKLDVVVIPPNQKLVRIDHPDVVYKTEREKFDAVVEEVAECYETRPAGARRHGLGGEVGAPRRRCSRSSGVKHNVLNAVNHEAEANVIAQAGRYRAVTIATNMAGRGTDILLGGNPEFLARSDMENEWIQRSAALPEGGQRYEDVLQKLRDRYDEADPEGAQQRTSRSGSRSRKRKRRRSSDLTEVHRHYLEAAFWQARTQYEDDARARLDGAAGRRGCRRPAAEAAARTARHCRRSIASPARTSATRASSASCERWTSCARRCSEAAAQRRQRWRTADRRGADAVRARARRLRTRRAEGARLQRRESTTTQARARLRGGRA